MESKDNQPKTKNQKNDMTTQSFNHMEVFTCRMALRMAAQSKGKMHLTNPVLVRRTATRLLTAIGVQGITNRTRWETLHATFEATFGVQIDEQDAQRKAEVAKAN
jgi:hypothetical protein